MEKRKIWNWKRFQDINIKKKVDFVPLYVSVIQMKSFFFSSILNWNKNNRTHYRPQKGVYTKL